MAFTWDPAKNEANVRKHGVPFSVATRIWEGPTKEKLDDREAYGEDRGISEP